MNKYTYKEKFHQTIPVSAKGYDCFVTDGFESFPDAVSAFSMQGRKVLLINEPQYGGFYLDRLKEAVETLGCAVTVASLPEKAEDLLSVVSDLYKNYPAEEFSEEDVVISLGGISADAAARLFVIRYAPKMRYIKIPVTFVAQLLSASPIDTQLDFNWQALRALGKASEGAESDAKGVKTKKGSDKDAGALNGEDDGFGGEDTDLLTALRNRNPDLVYINILAYKNLSETDRISGLGEVLRIGAGYDKDLFAYVEGVTGKRADYLFTFLMNVIMNCLLFGRAHGWKSSGDEPAQLIGNEIGLALEKCTNYIIPHGQAAVIGLVVAANISNKRDLLPNADHYTLAKVLASHGFVILMNFANELIDAICAQLPNAKKKDPSETVLLPKRIGTGAAASDVTPDEIRRAMNYRR